MIKRTKKERALFILSVMEEQKNVPRTLQCWLEIMNEHLQNKHLTFRSTKELAHTFKYLITGVHAKIIKYKCLAKHEEYNMANTYYTLMDKASKNSFKKNVKTKSKKTKDNCEDALLVRDELYE